MLIIFVCASPGLTGAVASTEVKQKLQEFLLSKSTKDGTPNGVPQKIAQSSKLWYT